MRASMESLPWIREVHSAETIALAGGVFDLLHPGHLDLFRHMKATADVAVVALSSDVRVKQRKGPMRPIHDQGTRLAVVEAIRYVDYALIAPEPSATEVPTVQMMRALRPDFFLTSEDSWLNFPEIFEELDTELRLVPRFSEEISTSRTIAQVLENHRD